MRRLWFILSALCLFSVSATAQNSQLAKQYFDDGDFKKALPLYEELYQSQSYNSTWLSYLIQCYQQLEELDKAESLLLEKLKETNRPLPLLEIDLGYNYILKKEPEKATPYFTKALEYLNEKPDYAATIGYRFHKYTLLEEAAQAYETGMKLDPNQNNSYALATIYGEQGNIEKMFDTLLDLMKKDKVQQPRIQSAIAQFITEDPENSNNLLLKRLLLRKSQASPEVLWNETLSWLFIQQEQYGQAFMQEKAVYKRSGEMSLDRLNDLALSAAKDKKNDVAIEIYAYIVENSTYNEAILEAELAIIKLQLGSKSATDPDIEKKFLELINRFGMIPQTVNLHVAYAHFIAFNKNQPEEASKHLKKVLDLRLSAFDEATVKLELADILVYQERFNEALIYYSQIQKKLKNDVVGQNAMFKVAQTSFYKGDFAWAENQLNILKSSTSQLIANDALQLKLLITDNSQDDSLQTALKIYAKADLMAYQHKNKEAISLLDSILVNHKGESIEDEALLKQGKLYEEEGEVDKAVTNYEKILAFYNDDILADDALFALATLYEHTLNNPDKAKEYYEKIIFDHQDSIFFVEARKAYRKLRGDNIGS